MTTIEADCKFCKKHLRIEVDEAYRLSPSLVKIIPMICCQRCADLRTRRREILEGISSLCWLLSLQQKPNVLQALQEEAREPLRKLLMAYRRLVEDWTGKSCGQWDEGILDGVLNAPKYFGNVLNRIWHMAKQQADLL